MCGIAGIAFNDASRQADEPMLRRMTAIMRYRGPDSEGFHVGPGIGLGMCRLSIIDTVSGDQPIANEDGSVVVICNGEIYNYVELREQLLAKGHRLRSHSDTEVIVHLYEDDPDGFLDKLRGMFALALWDANHRRLLLVRDRLGIKPLHYALTRDGIVFGSELKTILASGLIAPTRDDRALKQLFTLRFVRAPRTMVTEVQQVEPGQWLRFQAGEMTTRQYWDISFPNRDEYDRGISVDQWAERLRGKLEESVRLHLRSDVPVGAWLSAGVDSSAVTALMGRALRRPIHTFTVGFEDRAVDELERNRLLDQYPEYQLVGHRLECCAAHSEMLPQAVWHREQPFGLGVIIPRLLVSELAAKQVKVVLTGEGADEVFGGYPWYRAESILRSFASLPSPVRAVMARCLSGHWPGAARILMAPAEMNLERFGALIGSLAGARRGLFVSGDAKPDELKLPEAFGRWHPFAQLQYLDMKSLMTNAIIPVVDLPSMAHSLEARVPFLDHELMEFCAQIPPWIKYRWGREKYILRRAVRDALPPEICWRRKFGMRAPTRDLIAGIELSEKSLRDQGCFHPSFVMNLLAQHRGGQADQSNFLMAIATTLLWDDMFLKCSPCARP